mmetsp:Transcript_8846/g.16436  ORF Transcript_8846/g.16436 Transcript_8846/m.16436 type:complete len:156 (+) Transcript_8846:69-536(+)
MNQYTRQLRYFAEHHPKASSAVLIAGTGISFAAIVAFIEFKDGIKADRHATKNNGGKSQALSSPPSSDVVTPRNAQLAAMLENAKNSSWQQNLHNAADAQQRFMLPGQDVDGGNDAPEYVRRIDERSEEIIREEEEKRAREKEDENNPTRTRFWR